MAGKWPGGGQWKEDRVWNSSLGVWVSAQPLLPVWTGKAKWKETSTVYRTSAMSWGRFVYVLVWCAKRLWMVGTVVILIFSREQAKARPRVVMSSWRSLLSPVGMWTDTTLLKRCPAVPMNRPTPWPSSTIPGCTQSGSPIFSLAKSMFKNVHGSITTNGSSKPKCPSYWSRMWFIQTVEKNELPSHRTWMNFTAVSLSKRSQAQKNPYCVIQKQMELISGDND